MPSNVTSQGSKRARSFHKGKGGGKGKGKQKGNKGKGKGERIVTLSVNDCRQERSSDRRAVVKEKMLVSVLPKIADLSVDGSDTLFEVLSEGSQLSTADVKKYLGKPPLDRKKLVLQHYKVRWEGDAEFRARWPADRSDLTYALKEWANEQFIKRTSALIDLSPQGSRLSGDGFSTHSIPPPAAGEHGTHQFLSNKKRY